MKRFVLILLVFCSFSGYSQNALGHYKYVVVPEKFNFLKQNDQYSLNSLTKGLLQYKGFTAYFDNNELPAEVANNKCLALTADVSEKSGMFTTGLTLLLKDCRGNIVFKSKEGKSREKEYKVAYDMALRDAFTSLNQVSYADSGSTHAPTQPTITTTASAVPVKSTVAASTVLAPSTAAVSTVPVQSAAAASPAPVKSTIAASTVSIKSAADNQPAGTLYAQPIANGYQLIDTTPKIVLTLLKTSAENYFIAGNATVNGIVLEKNEDWFFEYYKDGKLVSEKLLVKF
jgi:hypothetical protein